MIVLGVILLIIGALANIGILWQIGIALAVIGAILSVLGAIDRPVLGRRTWF